MYSSRFQDVYNAICYLRVGKDAMLMKNFLRLLTRCTALEHTMFCIQAYVKHYEQLVATNETYSMVYEFVSKMSNVSLQQTMIDCKQLYERYNSIGVDRRSIDFENDTRRVLHIISSVVNEALYNEYVSVQSKIVREMNCIRELLIVHNLQDVTRLCQMCSNSYSYYQYDACRHHLCVGCAFNSLFESKKCAVCNKPSLVDIIASTTSTVVASTTSTVTTSTTSIVSASTTSTVTTSTASTVSASTPSAINVTTAAANNDNDDDDDEVVVVSDSRIVRYFAEISDSDSASGNESVRDNKSVKNNETVCDNKAGSYTISDNESVGGSISDNESASDSDEARRAKTPMPDPDEPELELLTADTPSTKSSSPPPPPVSASDVSSTTTTSSTVLATTLATTFSTTLATTLATTSSATSTTSVTSSITAPVTTAMTTTTTTTNITSILSELDSTRKLKSKKISKLSRNKPYDCNDILSTIGELNQTFKKKYSRKPSSRVSLIDNDMKKEILSIMRGEDATIIDKTQSVDMSTDATATVSEIDTVINNAIDTINESETVIDTHTCDIVKNIDDIVGDDNATAAAKADEEITSTVDVIKTEVIDDDDEEQVPVEKVRYVEYQEHDDNDKPIGDVIVKIEPDDDEDSGSDDDDNRRKRKGDTDKPPADNRGSDVVVVVNNKDDDDIIIVNEQEAVFKPKICKRVKVEKNKPKSN
ncbi:HOAR [Alphabaculovirus myunipunctae]|uniref:HOAR n=1 Tax=Mythimna unipuncta nucleopolyhedrovirus TaxID=447897 RepID=A0A2K9VS29_9ABAC|nr:HOAR [Mythimna unipuncta nucleopolyhedrovirus]AUV65263.1 HOAR [Mythimna unipuncta nucleopolyhedrovirus]